MARFAAVACLSDSTGLNAVDRDLPDSERFFEDYPDSEVFQLQANDLTPDPRQVPVLHVAVAERFP